MHGKHHKKRVDALVHNKQECTTLSNHVRRKVADALRDQTSQEDEEEGGPIFPTFKVKPEFRFCEVCWEEHWETSCCIMCDCMVKHLVHCIVKHMS